MAQPIKHDFESTATTVVSETAKWSLMGALGAAAIGAIAFAAVPVLGMGLVGALASTVSGATIAGTAGMMFSGLGAVITAGAAIAGAVAGLSTGGTAGAIGGGLLGIFKGGQRVSQENQAFREYVRGHTHDQQTKTTKIHNDGEIKGIQEGYKIGRADGEKVGFQKGQEFVVNEIQNHMAAHPELVEQAAAGAGAAAKVATKVETGSKAAALSASCKCESRVDMISQKRAEVAANKELGA